MRAWVLVLMMPTALALAVGGKAPPPKAAESGPGDEHLAAEVQALADAGKYQLAEEKAIDALRKLGADAEIFNLLGFAQRKQAKWNESITSYKKALEMAPNYHQAKEYLAIAYLNVKKVEQAKALHQELLKSSPDLAALVDKEARRLKIKW